MRCRIPQLVLALLLLTAAPAAAQIVRGRVIDDSLGTPLAGVTISLLRGRDVAARVLTDSVGRFLVRVADSAEYRVRADRLGYARTESRPLVLGLGGTTEVELRMRVQGIPLEPLVVRSHSGPERGRDAFMRRRELGRGVFLTEDSLKMRHMAHAVDALMGVPGISVMWGWRFTPIIKVWAGNHCLLYYVDHHTDRFTLGRGGFNGRYRTLPLDMIRAEGIVAVEVYADGRDVPPELVTTGNFDSRRPLVEQTGRCGVVRIWTRDAW